MGYRSLRTRGPQGEAVSRFPWKLASSSRVTGDRDAGLGCFCGLSGGSRNVQQTIEESVLSTFVPYQEKNLRDRHSDWSGNAGQEGAVVLH